MMRATHRQVLRGTGSVDAQNELAANVAVLADLMRLRCLLETERPRDRHREFAALVERRGQCQRVIGPGLPATGEAHAVLLGLWIGDRDNPLPRTCDRDEVG